MCSFVVAMAARVLVDYRTTTRRSIGARLTRLSRSSMDVAFRRVRPGDEVPPPPPELTEWAGHTAGGTAGGMAYGAMRGYRAAARDPAHARVAPIVAKRHRWMRAAHEGTMGGVRLGSFVAMFSAVQLASASRRGGGERDMWDTVAAGTITAAATGLAIPGGIGTRLRGAALGVVVGAGLCAPLGFITQELDRAVPRDAASRPTAERRKTPPRARAEAAAGAAAGSDIAGDVVERLERELRERGPTERRRWFPWFARGAREDGR